MLTKDREDTCQMPSYLIKAKNHRDVKWQILKKATHIALETNMKKVLHIIQMRSDI